MRKKIFIRKLRERRTMLGLGLVNDGRFDIIGIEEETMVVMKSASDEGKERRWSPENCFLLFRVPNSSHLVHHAPNAQSLH